MDTQRYRRLSTATGKASDEHVACMTRWVREHRDAKNAKKCRAIALKYKRALESELAYLKTRPTSERISRRMARIRDYLDLLDRDLELLQGHNGH